MEDALPRVIDPVRPRRYLHQIILLGLLVAGLLARLAFFTGTVGNDDLRHAYAGYFLFSSDAEKHAVVPWPDDVHYRRLGVNFPLWVVTRTFGVHDWSMALVPLAGSLLGITASFFLLRRISGLTAAVAGAALYAFLPEDVYVATLWLQDTIFCGVLALLLWMLVLAVERAGRSRFFFALLAGLVLGYLQYVKDTAFVTAGLVLGWFIWRRITERREAGLAATVLGGYVLAHLLAVAAFWPRHPEASYYLTETVAYFRDKTSYTYSNLGILRLTRDRLLGEWLFGYLAPAFPVLLACFLLDRRVRYKPLLLGVLGMQAFVLWGAMRMTQGQDRYILQLSVPFVLISALGLAWLLDRLPRGKPALPAALALALCAAASGAALHPRHQQYGSDRTLHLRAAYEFVERAAGPDEPVFAAGSGTSAYTLRTLYQLNGFRQVKGGLHDLSLVPLATRGYIVLSDMERKVIGTNPDCVMGLERVFHSGTRKRWSSVYRIDRPALPAQPLSRTVDYAPGDRVTSLTLRGAVKEAEPLADEWRISPKSNAPGWVLFNRKDSLRATLRGVQSGPQPARARFSLQVSCSRAAEVSLGVALQSASLSSRGDATTYAYARKANIGAEPVELTFQHALPADLLSFVVPAIRIESQAACECTISDVRLEVTLEDTASKESPPTSQPAPTTAAPAAP